MRCIKLGVADAFLLGDETAEDALRSRYTKVQFTVQETVNGNRVAFPVNKPYVPLAGAFHWPLLPLIWHRGGYFTGTARRYATMRSRFLGYVYPDGSDVPIKGNLVGNLPKTAHRVVWADRNLFVLVVDVLRRPR